MLRRRPAFALILIGVLGTSLGASSAVLAIAEAYLARPLPYPDAHRLVRFTRSPAPADIRRPQNTSALDRDGLLAEVADLVVDADVDGFTIVDGPSTSLRAGPSTSLRAGQTPQTILGAWIGAEIFPALGVRPALGRVFTAEEVAERSPVAVISHRLWTERYGADPGIVGRTLTLQAVEFRDAPTAFTVIGVLPPRFWHFDDRTLVLLPLRANGDVLLFRLRQGMEVEAAASRLTSVVAAMNPGLDARWSVALTTLQDEHVAPIRGMLFAVTAAVAMLLLIACSNLAMLQTVRALGRDHEFAVRVALGAGRSRLFTQLAVESVLLAAGSFCVAWGIAQLLITGILPSVESYVGRLLAGGSDAAALSGTVLALMAGVSLVCTAVLGVAPALRLPAAAVLRSHGARNATPQTTRARHVMVGLQVASTLVLLVGASLMMRTAWHLSHVRLGFDPHAVLTGAIVMAPPRYTDDGRRVATAERLMTALNSLPEVEAASLITGPAFGARLPRPVFRGPAPDSDSPTAVMVGATAEYFRALRLETLAGRPFSATEVASGERVAVISHALAKRVFRDDDAVGHMITTTALRPMLAGVEQGSERDARTTYRVVGVVADVRRSLRREGVPEVYVPLLQLPLRDLTVQVRARDGVPVATVASAVARALNAVDPELPLNNVETLEAVIARQEVRPRFLASVLGTFAALAAVGALVGLYAVSAWIARQRQREAAIRLALGAQPQQLVRALTLGGTISVVCGLAVGWWGSAALGRLLSTELTGISGGDVQTRLASAAVLFACCVTALYRPARAVARTSPAAALRE
jgi:putative ABC transport system permease protein